MALNLSRAIACSHSAFRDDIAKNRIRLILDLFDLPGHFRPGSGSNFWSHACFRRVVDYPRPAFSVFSGPPPDKPATIGMLDSGPEVEERRSPPVHMCQGKD
jgi:hypothetical protein